MKTYTKENEDTVTQCCICMRVKVIENGNISFVKMDLPDDKEVSHTYCSMECYKNWVAQRDHTAVYSSSDPKNEEIIKEHEEASKQNWIEMGNNPRLWKR